MFTYIIRKIVCNYYRVGRTARAGRGGVSVSLAGEQERSLVKEVIKQAKNPAKNRIIPPDIIEKYNKKLQSLEQDVERILQEEKSERELAKVENEANRVEKLLKVEDDKSQRSWFQTKKERVKEKSNLLIYFNIILYILIKKIEIAKYHCEFVKFYIFRQFSIN